MSIFETTSDATFDLPDFAGMTEFLRDYLDGGFDRVRGVIACDRNIDYLRDYLAEDKTEWCGGVTTQDAVDLIETPDTSLVAAIDEARAMISEDITPPQTLRRRTRRGVEFGDAIDSDRYLARVAECWDRSERMISPVRSLRLGVNLATVCTRDQASVIWRGAATAAAVDELTRRGFGVEVVAFSRVRGLWVGQPNRMNLNGFVAKRSNDPVDLASLSTICCSVGWYRQAFLASKVAASPHAVKRNLGLPTDVGDAASVGCDAIFDQAISSRSEAEDAVRRIVESLNPEGVEVA